MLFANDHTHAEPLKYTSLLIYRSSLLSIRPLGYIGKMYTLKVLCEDDMYLLFQLDKLFPKRPEFPKIATATTIYSHKKPYNIFLYHTTKSYLQVSNQIHLKNTIKIIILLQIVSSRNPTQNKQYIRNRFLKIHRYGSCQTGSEQNSTCSKGQF